MHRARRAGGVLALALLMLLPASASGTVVPPARRAATGTLTGDTSIRWRGTAGIRLVTRATGSLPDESMTLFLHSGTYAFVSMLADPQPRGCDGGRSHCVGYNLAKFPYAGEFVYDERPGHDHLTNAVRPPDIVARHLDVYLFTDGEATLRLRPRGYAGHSRYVAAGRVRGLARRLPGSCATVCGRTAATELAAGGATFDFGRRPGHLITHAITRTGRSAVPNNHPTVLRTCFYPSPERPDASARAADHPYGCSGGDDAVAGVGADDASMLHVGIGRHTTYNAGDLYGPRYIGFRAGQVWPEQGYNAGYGVWFNYGIG